MGLAPITRRILGRQALRIGGAALAAGLGGARGLVARGQPTATAEAGEVGSLAAMLALAPDLPALPEQATLQIAQFADCAAQAAAVGVEPPVPGDDASVSGWLRAIWWMPLPSPLREFSRDERWRELFGFDALQVDRSLVVGQPPVQLAIMQGRFDETELIAAWEASGYRAVDEPDAIVYSIAEEQEIDLSSDIGRLALSSMNNVAILPDGTLLTTSRLDRLRTAITTTRGEAASLLDRPDIAALVAAGDPGIAAGYLIAGEALSASDPAAAVRLDPEDRATVDAAGPMPPVALALLGLTLGGPLPDRFGDGAGTPEPAEADIPAARFVVSLLMDDRANAEAALPVVDARLTAGRSLANRQPYAEIFADWTADVAPDAPVLRITLTPAADRAPDVGFRMYYERDLAFVFWSPDAD